MQQPRRIIDISPPKKKEEPLKEENFLKNLGREKKADPPKKQKTSSAKFPWGVFIIILVLALPAASFLAIQFFFASANITLWPQTRTMNLQEQVLVRANQTQIDFDHAMIPGKLFEVEKSATRLYSSTGSQAQDGKAQGTVMVFNTQNKAQILISTTRFMSQEGKLFRSTERVVISPESSLDVKVTAAEAGAEYNIGPSNFSLPGLAGTPLYTMVYAKSSQSMSGGIHSTVSIVSASDIGQAKASLVDSLTKLAESDLATQVGSPWTIENSPFDVQILDASSLIKEGAQLAQFNVKGKVRVRILAYQKAQIQDFADHALQAQLANGEKIDEKSVQISIAPKNFDQKSVQLSLALAVSAHGYQNIDFNEVRMKVQGKEKGTAEKLLGEYSNLAKFQISLWPFWLTSLPQRADKIHINFVLD